MGPAALGALLVAATVLVYAPATGAQMVADDFLLVGRVSFRDAAGYFADTWGLGRNEYRPVTALTFAVDNALWGADPRGYHGTNLALYAAGVLLVFVWLRSLSGDTRIAFLAAALFLVHPVHHSRVSWIAARDGLVSGVFRLLCLWSYTRYRQLESEHRPEAARYRNLSVAMLLLGLLSYEGTVAVPALLAAVDLLLSTGSLRVRLAGAARRLVPFAAALAAYLVFWNVLFGGALGAYALSLDPAGAIRNYGSLLYMLAFGHNRVAGLLYVALAVLGFRALQQRRSLALVAVWVVLIGYLPFSLLEGFSRRFAYSSSVGYCLLLGLLLAGAAQGRARWRTWAAGGIAAALFAYYLVEARTRVQEWREAGEIAASIPRQLKQMHPELPAGAVLLFGGVPRMHRRAQVFPLGLIGVIEREYEGAGLQVRSDERPVQEWAGRAGGPGHVPRYYFDYDAGRRRLEQIQAPQRHVPGPL